MSATAGEPLPVRTLAAFTAPCLPIAAIGLPLVVYLPPYYAGTLGLPLATVGLIFLVVRLIDIPFDPLIGHWLDRTTTRFGRFRPWFAGGTLVLMAGVFLAFMAEPGITAAAALAGLLVMYLGYSASLVSHTAWGAVLSDDYHERSRIFGWWQAANLLGLFLILGVPPLAQWLQGDRDPAVGVHAMGWTIIVVLPLLALWNLAAVPERDRLGDQGHRVSDIIGVLRVPLLRRLLLVDLLYNLAPGITGALLLFFFEAARGYPRDQASALLLFYFAAGLLFAPFWIRHARRTTKHGAIVRACIFYAVAQTAVMLLPAGNFPLAAVGMAIAGVPAAATPFLLRAMLADLSDAETLRSGRERTGLFYAALVATQKLAFAIPVGFAYVALDLIGFDAKLGAANTAYAIDGLIAIFILPPAILALSAALVVRGWPIDAATQAANAAALSRA